MIGDSTYVKAGTEYDEAFRLTERTLGVDVLQTTFGYYGWTTSNGQGRLNWIYSGTSLIPDSLQDLTYTYDAIGNVLTVIDAKAGGTQTQTFTYDDLDRIKTAQASGGTGGTYGQDSYTYDANTGNLKTKAGVTNTYGDSNHPHAVTSRTGGWTYVYDANGNQNSRDDGTNTYTLTYDEESRLDGVSVAASATFVYDGDGNRVKGTVEGVTTIYVGDHYEVELGTPDVVRKYYYAGGAIVAMDEDGTLSWLFGDHLGSTSITADSGGTKIAELRYKAWGEERYASGTTPTTHQYTGQRVEKDLGFYYYKARWYDSGLGRFMQADILVPEPTNPLAFDRYAYVLNNPIKYADPTGRYICGDVEGNCGPDEADPPPLGPPAWAPWEFLERLFLSKLSSPLHPEDGEVKHSGFGGCNTIVGCRKGFHVSVDSPGVSDRAIYALLTGVVVDVGEIAGFGKYIVIEHSVLAELFYTIYAHLNSSAVEVGSIVGPDTQIGGMGETGTKGVHLHWEARKAAGIQLWRESPIYPFTGSYQPDGSGNFWAYSYSDLEKYWVNLGNLPWINFHEQYSRLLATRDN